MIKTFTIKEYKFKEISKGKGSIEYHLVDELNVERMVTAVAKLGWKNKIKSVHAVYQRESFLVNALTHTSVNDKIKVDFSGFNQKNPRLVNNKQGAALRGTLKPTNNSKIDQLGINKFRLIQLLIMSLLIFAVILSIKGFV